MQIIEQAILHNAYASMTECLQSNQILYHKSIHGSSFDRVVRGSLQYLIHRTGPLLLRVPISFTKPHMTLTKASNLTVCIYIPQFPYIGQSSYQYAHQQMPKSAITIVHTALSAKLNDLQTACTMYLKLDTSPYNLYSKMKTPSSCSPRLTSICDSDPAHYLRPPLCFDTS